MIFVKDPDRAQELPPLWQAGRRNLVPDVEAFDDCVRYERLAAIGKIGHRAVFIKGRLYNIRKCREENQDDFICRK